MHDMLWSGIKCKRGMFKLCAEGQTKKRKKEGRSFCLWNVGSRSPGVWATVSQPGWLASRRLQANIWVVGPWENQQMKLTVHRCMHNAAPDAEIPRAAFLPQRLMLHKSKKPGKVEHTAIPALGRGRRTRTPKFFLATQCVWGQVRIHETLSQCDTNQRKLTKQKK